YFLVGLQVPYVLISDTLFSRSKISALDILVVPFPETLADTSLKVIQSFVEEGGGLIASGYSGKESKNRQSNALFRALTGIEKLEPMGVRSGRIRQKLQGGHMIGKNLPIGFELDLLSNQEAYVAHVDEGRAVGPAVISGDIQSFTCMVSNAYGEGRVVWMGFSPQDVPPNSEQQRGYQELLLDAFVFASGSSHASVRRWPQGYQSASSFIQLPSSGYQPFSYRTSTDLLLQVFTKHDVQATFFVVLGHAQDHPDLLERMVENGELGLVSDSPKPLSGLPEEMQYERLSVSKWLLENEYEQSLSGALPPGYFYDANTLHVLSRLDIKYILSDARHFQEPMFMEWENELDYRDSLVARVEVDSLMESTPQKDHDRLLRIYPSLFSYDLDVPLSKEEERVLGGASFENRWAYRMREGFNRVHLSGGLFGFGFEPETMGLSKQRADLLDSFVGSLSGHNTWVAPLDAVIDWWRGRDSVSVFLEEVSGTLAALRIENGGDKVLEGVSLDLYLPDVDGGEFEIDAGELQVSIVEQTGSTYLVQVQRLPKGEHMINLMLRSEGVGE
ncbi:MAG: polysaccharide deacetylase family protein, partial [Rhodothermaceae bacterium]|nr:polysaccharide deacetylase family protein [Rhodothermaceae bacterium]